MYGDCRCPPRDRIIGNVDAAPKIEKSRGNDEKIRNIVSSHPGTLASFFVVWTCCHYQNNVKCPVTGKSYSSLLSYFRTSPHPDIRRLTDCYPASKIISQQYIIKAVLSDDTEVFRNTFFLVKGYVPHDYRSSAWAHLQVKVPVSSLYGDVSDASETASRYDKDESFRQPEKVICCHDTGNRYSLINFDTFKFLLIKKKFRVLDITDIYVNNGTETFRSFPCFHLKRKFELQSRGCVLRAKGEKMLVNVTFGGFLISSLKNKKKITIFGRLSEYVTSQPDFTLERCTFIDDRPYYVVSYAATPRTEAVSYKLQNLYVLGMHILLSSKTLLSEIMNCFDESFASSSYSFLHVSTDSITCAFVHPTLSDNFVPFGNRLDLKTVIDHYLSEGSKSWDTVGKLHVEFDSAGSPFAFVAPNSKSYFIQAFNDDPSFRAVVSKGLPSHPAHRAIAQFIQEKKITSSRRVTDSKTGRRKTQTVNLSHYPEVDRKPLLYIGDDVVVDSVPYSRPPH